MKTKNNFKTTTRLTDFNKKFCAYKVCMYRLFHKSPLVMRPLLYLTCLQIFEDWLAIHTDALCEQGPKQLPLPVLSEIQNKIPVFLKAYLARKCRRSKISTVFTGEVINNVSAIWREKKLICYAPKEKNNLKGWQSNDICVGIKTSACTVP